MYSSTLAPASFNSFRMARSLPPVTASARVISRRDWLLSIHLVVSSDCLPLIIPHLSRGTEVKTGWQLILQTTLRRGDPLRDKTLSEVRADFN